MKNLKKLSGVSAWIAACPWVIKANVASSILFSIVTILVLCLNAQAQSPQFALYSFDEAGFPTNRVAVAGYSVTVTAQPFRTVTVRVSKVVGGIESDWSQPLVFVPTNAVTLLAWDEPLFVSVRLQTGPGAAGPWRDAGRVALLTNPVGNVFYKLEITGTNSP